MGMTTLITYHMRHAQQLGKIEMTRIKIVIFSVCLFNYLHNLCYYTLR